MDLTKDLHTAIVNDQDEKVEQLIANGADVNHKSSDGKTALVQACINNKLSCVQLLLDANADPELACEVTGMRPLHWAARKRSHLEIVKVRCPGLKFGAPNYLCSSSFQYFWCPCFEFGTTQALLTAGASVDALSNKKQTALATAATADCVDNVKALVEVGNADLEAADSKVGPQLLPPSDAHILRRRFVF
eukprot:SAG31_NODE_3264_length_4481_cov_17.400218_2_plen_191_part_00